MHKRFDIEQFIIDGRRANQQSMDAGMAAANKMTAGPERENAILYLKAQAEFDEASLSFAVSAMRAINLGFSEEMVAGAAGSSIGGVMGSMLADMSPSLSFRFRSSWKLAMRTVMDPSSADPSMTTGTFEAVAKAVEVQ